MPICDRTAGGRAPAIALFFLLVLAAVSSRAPAEWTLPVRRAWQRLLLPSERQVAAVRRAGDRLVHGFFNPDAVAASDLLARVAQAEERNRELEDALELSKVASEEPGRLGGKTSQPDDLLLKPVLIEAQLLGRQAQSFLERRHVITHPPATEATPGDWVLSGPTWLDRGENRGLAPDDLALRGRRVWGMVCEVAPETATVRRVADAGYRDLVQLAHSGPAGPRPGPRGVLEGEGNELCRIRRVPASAAVSVGDLVLTAGHAGLAAFPLVYGKVVRVERALGSNDWQIWMRPAAGEVDPPTVTVLTARLNSAARTARSDAGRLKRFP